MASELAPQSMSVHNSKEGCFEFGAAGAKGCCGKMRWNTVRQGSVWINGIFCEQGAHMNNGNYVAVGSVGASTSLKTEHSEEDCGSKEMVYKGLICSESSPKCSALFKGQIDTTANEKVEELSQIEKDTRRDCALTDNGTSIDGCGTLSKQIVLLQTNCNDDFSLNGFNKEYLQHQQGRCHTSIGVDLVGGAPQNTCVPNVAAQDITLNDLRASQEYISTDVCQRSMSTEVTGVKGFNTPQYDRGLAETEGVHNNVGNTTFSLCNEEHRDGEEVGLKHAMYVEQNPGASRNDFVCEGKEGVMLPLVIRGEDQSTEARKEEYSVRSSIRGGNQAVEARNEEGLFGSCKDDVFSNEDETRSGILQEEALLYALPYMGLQDILSMERVSKIFRDWVRNNVSLWQRLHVEPPLSKKLTDEALLQLAARSKGQLQCLNLVDCLRVTEGAVEHVVCSNPRLSKLCLPGCSRISAEAVLRMVESHTNHRVPGLPGLKQLRLRNIYDLTKEHLDILLTMLGDGEQAHSGLQKPQYYQNGHYSFSCDDQRPIDVEACPKCSNVRLVYDCTRKRCQQRRGDMFQECRACILCIVRCEECGRCINDNDYEETFCLDLLCSSCWLRLPKCSECNRPGCGRHADHFIRTPETTFVCSDCCASPGSTGPEFHVYAGFDI